MSTSAGPPTVEGEARVYTVRHLRESPDAVRKELNRPEVAMAVVVDADDAGVHHVAHRKKVRAVVKAEDLASSIGATDMESTLKSLETSKASVNYEVDPTTKRLRVSGVDVMYALSPSGIQLASPDPGTALARRYRCTGAQHHIVNRPVGSDGDPCPKKLADGTDCPGILRAF